MGLLDKISPTEFQKSVARGRKRLSAFRMARFKFILAYGGGYYDAVSGSGQMHPLPLLYHAIRILAPNLVMDFPKHVVETPYLEHKEYAEKLSLALSYDDRKQRIRDKYTRAIIDAPFGLGILKTGLGKSDQVLRVDDEEIDPGELYTGVVDFDNFIADPLSREHLFEDASYLGDIIQVPRYTLLDMNGVDHDLATKLPRVSVTRDEERVEDLSHKQVSRQEDYDVNDIVEIAEIWVPSENALVIVPGDCDATPQDDYLKISDYYGVKEGPYTLLSFSPPMPGNPIPVPLAGTWFDLAVALNRIARKEIQQAEAQKDIYTYQRTAVDDATAMRDAMDGEGVACDDPAAVKVVSLGGQKPSNERQVGILNEQFNTYANNPEAVGGYNISAKSATGANILNQRSNVGLEDMRNKVYIMSGEEARRRAFYIHTDPLIHAPMARRLKRPAVNIVGMNGQPIWMQPAHEEEISEILTPEERQGEFFDFTFTVETQSMSRLDAQTRLQQESTFAQQIVPAVVAAANGCAQIQLPFNARTFLLRFARDAGIDWMPEVLLDPQTAQEQAAKSAAGPPPDGNAKRDEAQQPNSGLGSQLQNGQPGQVMGNPNPVGGARAGNQASQLGAQESQRALSRTFARGLGSPAKAFSGT